MNSSLILIGHLTIQLVFTLSWLLPQRRHRRNNHIQPPTHATGTARHRDYLRMKHFPVPSDYNLP